MIVQAQEAVDNYTGIRNLFYVDFESKELLPSFSPYLYKRLSLTPACSSSFFYPITLAPYDLGLNNYSLHGAIIHLKMCDLRPMIHNRLGPAIISVEGRKLWALDGFVMKPLDIFEKLSSEEQSQVLWELDQWV